MLPDHLCDGLSKDGLFQRRAGKCFSQRVGHRFGRSQVHIVRKNIEHGAQRWLVKTEASSPDFQVSGELGESRGLFFTPYA